MTKRSKIALTIFATIAAIPAGWLIYIRMGPTGPVPPRDPVEAWNEAHAGLIENAAEPYERAIAELAASGPSDWQKRSRKAEDELPEDLAQWALAAEPVVALIREGAACETLWYDFQSGFAGAEPPDLAPIRGLGKFLQVRARAAAARRDEAVYGESLVLLDRLGRQIMTLPMLIPRLIGVSCAAGSQEFALAPFAWGELDEERADRYEQLIRPLDEPYPDIAGALRTERDAAVWSGRRHGFAGRLVFPPARVAGEIDYRLDPLLEVAAEPLQRQLDPDDPLIVEHETRQDRRSSSDLSVEVSRILVASNGRAVVLNARLLVLQQGNRAVRLLLAHSRELGGPPESLDVFDDAASLADPFTGQPMIYRKTAGGFTLYSAGLNGVDDGGDHHAYFGEGRKPRKDWDYVFWPLPETGAP